MPKLAGLGQGEEEEDTEEDEEEAESSDDEEEQEEEEAEDADEQADAGEVGEHDDEEGPDFDAAPSEGPPPPTETLRHGAISSVSFAGVRSGLKQRSEVGASKSSASYAFAVSSSTGPAAADDADADPDPDALPAILDIQSPGSHAGSGGHVPDSGSRCPRLRRCFRRACRPCICLCRFCGFCKPPDVHSPDSSDSTVGPTASHLSVGEGVAAAVSGQSGHSGQSGKPQRSQMKGQSQWKTTRRRHSSRRGAGSPSGGETPSGSSPRSPSSPGRRGPRTPGADASAKRRELRRLVEVRGRRGLPMSPAAAGKGSARGSASPRPGAGGRMTQVSTTTGAKGRGKGRPQGRAAAVLTPADLAGLEVHEEPVHLGCCMRRCPKRCREAYIQQVRRRREFWRDVDDLVQIILEEEEYDWDDLGEDGNPRRVQHTVPRSVRKRWQIFLIVYWDPLVEAKSHIPGPFRLMRWAIRLVPFMAFVGALIWYLRGYTINIVYLEGDCVVEGLPTEYKSTGTLSTLVSGIYTVKRSFPPTQERVEGFVLQECEAQVDCDHMAWGAAGGGVAGRCTDFRTWKWGDAMECYYHKDDLYGDQNQKLYCLRRPANLQQALTTVVVSAVILLTAFLTAGFMAWRARRRSRQERKEIEVAVEKAAEIAEAKRKIEERANDEARRLHQGHIEEEDLVVEETDIVPTEQAVPRVRHAVTNFL